jgi:SWI/SNF-related matrix-associated actin-dependent regulator of chromatin subfamily D
VNRFLAPPEPVVLHYTVDPALSPPERPRAWDVELKMEDMAMKGRMNVVLQANKEVMAELVKLDEEVRVPALLLVYH